MKNKLFATLFALLSTGTLVYAGGAGRYALYDGIRKNPSILLEPWFWIVVVVCLVLVGIYYITKDK